MKIKVLISCLRTRGRKTRARGPNAPLRENSTYHNVSSRKHTFSEHKKSSFGNKQLGFSFKNY